MASRGGGVASRVRLPRLFRLWRAYALLDLLFVTRNARSLVIYYVTDAVLIAASVAATLLLAARFDGIGAWSRDQVVFMLGYAMLCDALTSMFAAYNVYYVSRRIGRGQLDHTLVQPLPIWLALLGEGFAPFSGSGALLPATGLLLWAGVRLGVSISPGWLALFTLNMVGSLAVLVSFAFAWSCLAFWAPRAAEEITSTTNRMMSQLKAFPLDGVSPLLTGGLLTVIPSGFAAWYPSRALLGVGGRPTGALPESLITPAAGLALALVTAVLFSAGLRHYARTGSQRYLNWGFRR